MKKIVVISIGIIVLLIVFCCCIVDSKQSNFYLNNGIKIVAIMQYNRLDNTFTSTVKVEDGWASNGFLEFLNPVVLTVTGLTFKGENRVDVHYHYRDFIGSGGHHEASKKTNQMRYKTFKEIKKVEISSLIANW